MGDCISSGKQQEMSPQSKSKLNNSSIHPLNQRSPLVYSQRNGINSQIQSFHNLLVFDEKTVKMTVDGMRESKVDPSQSMSIRPKKNLTSVNKRIVGQVNGDNTVEPQAVVQSNSELDDFLKDLQFLEILGKGSFGKVVKTWSRKLGRFLALKYINYEKEKTVKSANHEISMMRKITALKHKHLMRHYFTYEDVKQDSSGRSKKEICLVLEYGRCSLKDILDSGRIYNEKEILGILEGVLDGLELLERKARIAHSDIKPGNFILNKKMDGYQVCDFGVAEELQPDQTEMEAYYIGSPVYMSPLLFANYSRKPKPKKIKYNPFKSDVYSMGLTILNMVGLKYKAFQPKIRESAQIRQKTLYELLNRRGYTEIGPLLEGMLKDDEEERWNFRDARKFVQELIKKVGVMTINEENFVLNLGAFQENQMSLEQQCEHYGKLKMMYQQLGLYNEALNYAYKELNVLQERSDADKNSQKDTALQQSLADSYHWIGYILNCLEQNEEAIQWQKKALQMRRQMFGPSHPTVATSINNLGSSYDSMGDYETAIKFYQESLEIRKKNHGENHPDVATSLNNLGCAYYSLDKFELSIDYHLSSLKIKRAVYNDNHPDIATSLNNLGSAFDSLGKYEKAIEYYKSSLAIKIEAFGDNHPSVATSYNNLAAAYKNMQNYQKAVKYYEMDLSITKKVYGDTNAHIINSLNNLGSVYTSYAKSSNDVSKLEIAYQYFKNSIKVIEKLAQPDKGLKEHTQNLIDTCKNKIMQWNQQNGKKENSSKY